MDHDHRLELRIVVPRRAPVRIEIDAQDVARPVPPAWRPRRDDDPEPLALPA